MIALAFPDPLTVSVQTDENGVRHYQFPKRDWMVSATTVLGIIAKGYGFDNWIATCERDAYDKAIAEAILEPVSAEYLLATVKAKVGKRLVYTTVRDAAADQGLGVHDAVRAFLTAEVGLGAPPVPKLSAEGLIAFSTFVGWWQESGLKAVAMEQPVYEPEWEYAGTFDILAERPDGSRGIVDLKNTKWISNSYHYQVAAYMRAVRQWTECSWGSIVKLPKNGRPLEIVGLGEKMWGGERTEAACIQAFYHALELWRCENRGAR